MYHMLQVVDEVMAELHLDPESVFLAQGVCVCMCARVCACVCMCVLYVGVVCT